MKRALLTIFVSAVILFTGCKKDSTTAPVTDPTPKSPDSGQPMPDFGGDVDGVVAAIQFSYSFVGMPVSVDMDMGFASFGDGVDAGTVTVNGKTIAKSTSGSTVYYNSFASTDPLNPPTSLGLSWYGQPHVWNVTGAGSIPAFTITVQSPSKFTVSNPTTATTASKSSPLTVTWSGASSNSQDSVMIMLVSLTGSATVTATTSNTTGTYAIPAAQLGGFSGDAMLEVVKYRYAVKTESNKTFVGVAEIVNTVNFKIQ